MLRSRSIWRSLLLGGVLLCSATAVRADRTLCSTVLQPGNPGWLSEKEGEIHRLRDGFRFTPPRDPKTIQIKLPLPQNRDFRLYSELAFETQTKDANSAITVEVEAFCSWSACRIKIRSIARSRIGLTSYGSHGVENIIFRKLPA